MFLLLEPDIHNRVWISNNLLKPVVLRLQVVNYEIPIISLSHWTK